MSESPILDHMVINVQFQMDEAESAFERLGFTNTPRGYHSLGSINHLMILGTDYLELIGLPAGEPPRRAELVNAPAGFNGLVFKTADVGQTYEHLRSLGMDGDPPKSFTRPVQLGDESAEASFSTVTVRAGVFEGGRVYFCQHHTPELVWREEWQRHRNGAFATAEFIIVARDAASESQRYASLLQREVGEPASDQTGLCIDLDGSTLTVLSPEQYRARFGELALPMRDASACFGGISLRSRSLPDVTALLREGADNVVREVEGRVQVAVPAFATVLEFTD